MPFRDAECCKNISVPTRTPRHRGRRLSLGGPGGPGGGVCPSGSLEYNATRFIYARNKETVTYVTGEQWCAVDNSTGHVTFQTLYAKEFRYDGTRQRYLSRDVGTAALYHKAPDEAVWSDYDGNSVYGDYTVTSGVAADAASYEPGMWKIDSWVSSGSTNTDYYHDDHHGTTRMITDDLGVQGEDAL